jgi:hypothetical protein
MQNDTDHVRDITPWSGLSTEKVTAAQLSNTFPAFYRHNRSTTRTASHRCTSSARQIQFTPSFPSFSFKFQSLICLGRQDGAFPEGLPTKPVHEFPSRSCLRCNFEKHALEKIFPFWKPQVRSDITQYRFHTFAFFRVKQMTLRMKALRPTETSGTMHPTTLLYVPHILEIRIFSKAAV